MRSKIQYLLRIVVGVVFLISSLTKLLSIDSFEIYLFSLELLPLGLTFIAARALIGVEAVLGFWFILDLNHNATNILSFVFLGLFSGFLFGQLMAGNQENCHCFGAYVNLTPQQSLIKNAALVLLILLSGGRWFRMKFERALSFTTFIVPLALVFIVSPPDNFRYDSYKSSEMINIPSMNQAIADQQVSESILQGEKILCFFSVRCEFCAMSAKKLGILRRLGDFSRAEVIAYFGKGEQTTMEDAETFISDAKLDCKEIHFISPSTFLKITNGEYPLIVHFKDGEIIDTYSYRDLH